MIFIALSRRLMGQIARANTRFARTNFLEEEE